MIDIQKYREMDCPVCGKFYFSKLDDDDIALFDIIQCSVCGWINDLAQTENPDSTDGANELSLNAYRKNYEKILEENPDYNFLESTFIAEPHKCPVCENHVFPEKSSFLVCPYCGWEDDELMEAEPDKWAGCSNDLCLNDFRDRYYRYKNIKSYYKFNKDGFLK